MSNAAERTNVDTGIKINLLNRKTILEALASAGDAQTDDPNVSTEQLSISLRSTYKKLPNRKQHLQCDDCLAYSPPDLDDCPFCGGVDDAETAAAKKQVAAEADDDEEIEIDEAEDEDETSEPESEPEAVKKPDKKGTQNLVKLPKKKASAQAIEKVSAAKVAIAKPIDAATKSGAKELDKAIADVERLKGDTSVQYWHLGRRINDIYEGQLWKHRVDDQGKAIYKGFEAFVTNELGMTPQGAYKALHASMTFSIEEVRLWGSAKIGLLVEAPVEDQKRLTAQIKKTGNIPTYRALETEVRDIKKAKKHTKPTLGGKTVPKTETRAHVKREPTITVANVIGRKKIKLWKKPLQRDAPEKEMTRSKRLADMPFGRMELVNDVNMYFTLQEDEVGHLILVVETRRVEAT